MPGFNLIRNARAFFTTNLNNARVVQATGFTAANAFELQVLNGFSYSQNTETQTITVNEAGLNVARGQRTFNTALAPVEFSFSTYIRPSGTTTIDAEEKVLWNALMHNQPIDLTGLTVATVSAFTRTASSDIVTFTCAAANLQTAGIAVGDVVTVSSITGADAIEWNAPAIVDAITAGTVSAATGIRLKYLRAPAGVATAPAAAPTTLKLHKGAITQNAAAAPEAAYMLAHSGGSNKNQLQSFGMIIIVDGVTYLIDNCALNQATIDFGLDGIAMVQWTGNGTALRQLGTNATAAAGTFGGGLTGNYTQKNVTANFITQKLATVNLASNLRGLGSSTSYSVAITGGSFTINNNIQYITPEILGVVNTPIGYYTGTRAISGTLNAYLKTGTNGTASLLSDMLAASATTTEPKYAMEIAIGGHTNGVRVELDLPAVMLQIPTVETQDVLSTTINFTAEGFTSTTSAAAGGTADFDIEQSNELFIRYYSA